MEITYLGHSCMKLVHNGFALILDPYQNNAVPGLMRLEQTANQVLCSHDHFDHNAIDEVKFSQARVDTPFRVDGILTFHDDQEGALRGNDIIHIIEVDNLKIVHMGDIGCMISDEDIERIEGCDILMIPVGGFYTIDAKMAKEYCKKINPKMIIPIHYRGEGFGYDVIAPVDDFIKLWDESKVVREGSTITITNKPEGGRVVIMKPLKARI